MPSHKKPSFQTNTPLPRAAMNRRSFLRGGAVLAGLTAGSALSGCAQLGVPALELPFLNGLASRTRKRSTAAYAPLTFTEIAKQTDDQHHLAKGYQAQRLLSWGDAVFGFGGWARDDSASETGSIDGFSPVNLSPETQALRFGYNNDFIAYMPLGTGDAASRRGLLCINHEYPNSALMFPELPADFALTDITERMAQIEIQSLGVSVVEVAKDESGQWQAVADSLYNRRITGSTPIYISGPAAGHKRMRTRRDPGGMLARGTFGNCAGGKTPWGTVLTAEENVNFYFGNLEGLDPDHREQENHRRMGVGTRPLNAWYLHDKRFDVTQSPTEANHFGWVVEYDPYDRERPAVKRTALGRFKHECATTTVTPDGRVVVYSGDDEQFEYIYRFISSGKIDWENREANFDLLDEGVLSVAKFAGDGTMRWLPLIYGQNGLDETNGFASQADVLIETRKAADIMGATPMDRPEDVEVNPASGQLFVSLTKNKQRKMGAENPANRRGPNPYGHILELTPPLSEPSAEGEKPMPDHSAERFEWDGFLEAGNPDKLSHKAHYQGEVSAHGWLTNPDNFAFDPHGRIWICTDGQGSAKGVHTNEGVYAAQTEGKDKGVPRLFFSGPKGAEVAGPEFTPDGKTLFLSIQHPGESPKGSTYHAPSTRWPDFREDIPPRPSVIAITKGDGGEVGE